MQVFIREHLRKLKEGITGHVDDTFHDMKGRVDRMDQSLEGLEQQIDN